MNNRSSAAERLPDPPAPAEASAPPPALGGIDAVGLQRLLRDRIDVPAKPASEPATAPSAPPPKPALLGPSRRRALKILLGVAVVLVFGAAPLRALLEASSVQAVVNARIVTLRAPIAGEVEAGMETLLRADVAPRGTPLLKIVNPRADRSRLDDLRRKAAHLSIERDALDAKRRPIMAELQVLDAQVEAFRAARIEQLQARTAELQAEITSAAARRDDAAVALDRGTFLIKTGSLSPVALTRQRRELAVAEATVDGANSRLAAAAVELTAARAGVFVGDSYNDRPGSAQRAAELRQRAADLSADIASTEADITQTTTAAAEEERRYDLDSAATVALPTAGRIWEVLTAPGEEVRVGQDLIKVLDCSGAVVTSNVTESTYNRLRIGAPATFRPADGGPDLTGTIMSLTGIAGAPANLAIAPAALGKEPYRVTVAVPGLAGGEGCTIGRTGRVIFGTAGGIT